MAGICRTLQRTGSGLGLRRSSPNLAHVGIERVGEDSGAGGGQAKGARARPAVVPTGTGPPRRPTAPARRPASYRPRSSLHRLFRGVPYTMAQGKNATIYMLLDAMPRRRRHA